MGLRPPHHSIFMSASPKSVNWVEVISENFMPWEDGDFRNSLITLTKIREHYAVSLHGVSGNLGSTDKLDLDYFKRLKKLIHVIQPVTVSDHIAWTGVGGVNTHDLLPLPYTEECLQILVQKIDQVQNLLGTRIILENPSSYLEYWDSEMSEADFIVELLRRADCGLLLDINNVYVSSVNHNFEAKSYIQKIPKERVAEIHLAGHSNKDGFLIDTHDTPVCNEVWELYRWYVENFGPSSVMIERDGKIPAWSELESEIANISYINASFATSENEQSDQNSKNR